MKHSCSPATAWLIAALSLLRSKPGAHVLVRPLDGAEQGSAYLRLALSRRERQKTQAHAHYACISPNHSSPEGDTVIGTLPVNLAAEVCARSARYLHLSLEVPREVRGRDLTADEMNWML